MDVDDRRHWANDLDDSADPSLHTLHSAINTLLPKIETHLPRGPSIYHGVCGVALLYLRLADHFPDRSSHYLSKSLNLTQHAEQLFSPRRFTFLEGITGVWALQAAIHHAKGDTEQGNNCISKLLDFYDKISSSSPYSECEVLYGRCGYLQAILFLRRRLRRENLGREIVERVTGDILTYGSAQARARVHGDDLKLYYEWHGKCYLGAAHGYAGILYVLSQFPNEVRTAGFSADTLKTSASYIMERVTFLSGNIASSLNNNGDRLVHWCHGAPGWVDTCIAVERLDAATRLGDVIWTRGLLSRKGPGLCHGIPGNGYAFLSLWQATGNSLWLRRARHFAVFTAERIQTLISKADEPYSMFEGAAGAVSFFLDCLNPEKATSIFFDRFS